MLKKIYNISDKVIDSNTSSQEFLTILLKNRNLRKEDLKEFLNPSDPVSLKASDINIDLAQLSKAVGRIRQAIDNQENILIYGDYDVDGITSSAILWQALNKSGAKVTPFVPDRELDGYGFNYKSFLRFQEEKNIKFDLLITVDNGIVASKEFEQIKDQKLDIIVTDHHLPHDSGLPDVFAIVHSTLVSGSIIAWFLASKFYKDTDIGLAALGAVADCVPLIGVNRSIVFYGLKKIQTNPSYGLKKLIEISGSKQEEVTTYDLGFLIGPRINAVGRLANPTEALRLLCSPTPELAQKYALTLNEYNKDRQSLQKENIESAEKLFQDSGANDKLIYISDPEYHPGIIGLIAGRLTEKYYLPSIVMSVGETESKGSCRSIKEVNIIEVLRKFDDLFVDVGGHAGAAGFTIKNENIPILKEKLTSYLNEELKSVDLTPTINVDAEMKLSAVNVNNCNLIKKLEPFGFDNNEPYFLFKDLKIIYKRIVGSTGDHLKLKFDDPTTSLIENLGTDAIAFKKGDMDKILNTNDLVDVIAKIDTNTWNNVTTAQLMVKEIIPKK